ncbi:hypothetical protein H310_10035 [Aphanomyces invadans]|uniref:Uncharacterized protein n=1 Tax=Aphanomyces invadans TaxID=157072 RepID=A0A024TRR7_9STRA|nr:hypothetical protein H310_10035 [Aphanomyces invadans]ETV96718.1 hypothetical protein H310_10035 [Aphanomyces invadans]|eukprot:XP_008874495.1 hypothetical protein H310_10035 [Aphanomyces invadans]
MRRFAGRSSFPSPCTPLSADVAGCAEKYAACTDCCVPGFQCRTAADRNTPCIPTVHLRTAAHNSPRPFVSLMQRQLCPSSWKRVRVAVCVLPRSIFQYSPKNPFLSLGEPKSRPTRGADPSNPDKGLLEFDHCTYSDSKPHTHQDDRAVFALSSSKGRQQLGRR